MPERKWFHVSQAGTDTAHIALLFLKELQLTEKHLVVPENTHSFIYWSLAYGNFSIIWLYKDGEYDSTQK